jgi:hypothetical protein
MLVERTYDEFSVMFGVSESRAIGHIVIITPLTTGTPAGGKLFIAESDEFVPGVVIPDEIRIDGV